VIRTTNLPKNVLDFPYILEDIPNEMYEMPFFLSERVDYFKTPKQVFDEGYFTKEGLDVSLARFAISFNILVDIFPSTDLEMLNCKPSTKIASF